MFQHTCFYEKQDVKSIEHTFKFVCQNVLGKHFSFWKSFCMMKPWLLGKEKTHRAVEA